MNDKWNPRLWLRDWLLKPSGSEASIREGIGIASEVMAAVQEKMKTADYRLSRSINAVAQGEPKATGYARPISACDFTLDVREGRVVGLKLLSDHFALNESPGTP